MHDSALKSIINHRIFVAFCGLEGRGGDVEVGGEGSRGGEGRVRERKGGGSLAGERETKR